MVILWMCAKCPVSIEPRLFSHGDRLEEMIKGGELAGGVSIEPRLFSHGDAAAMKMKEQRALRKSFN